MASYDVMLGDDLLIGKIQPSSSSDEVGYVITTPNGVPLIAKTFPSLASARQFSEEQGPSLFASVTDLRDMPSKDDIFALVSLTPADENLTLAS